VEPGWVATRDVLPEYNNHGDVLNAYWPRLVDERPDFQFHLVDGDEVVARARAIPIPWDGTVDDLPAGIDGAIARGFEDPRPATALCALLIAVPARHQRGGVSAAALAAMVELGRRHGHAALVAPVRPSWKERYPLAPIERYAAWTRSDGLPLDPWLRVHVRAGGEILHAEPESLRITATVEEWETWTRLPYPESGPYVFPHGLAPLAVDREGDVGRYWEPNVWVRHSLSP
jgi:hypothetical protein